MPPFKEYLKSKGKKESSINIYCFDVNQLKPRLPYYIKDIKLSDIEHAISQLSVNGTTKTKKAKSLSRFLSVAKIKGIIQDNPIHGFEFKTYRPQINPYTEQEIYKLIEAGQRLQEKFNEPYYVFITLAFQTSLRLNEYRNLRWSYLRGNTYRICIDGSFRPKHDYERTIKIPKKAPILT